MAAIVATNSNFMFFEHLPNDLVLMIACELSPSDLLSFIFTCKRFYHLITSSVQTFANLYNRTSFSATERFLWGEINSPYFIMEKKKLFFRMIRIHQLAKANILTRKWYYHSMHYTYSFGPLPDDEKQLYIKNYQAWMILSFNNCDGILSSGIQTYAFNENDFIFFFKFINKYKTVYQEFHENVCVDIQNMISSGMTFEQLDSQMMRCLEYGGKEEHIYTTIVFQSPEDYEYYLSLLMHGIDSDIASTIDVIYTPDQLGCYKALCYIIGEQFAFEYVLKRYLDINENKGFLEVMSRLYLLGVNQIDIADFVFLNQREEIFNAITIQMQTFGSILYKEDLMLCPDESSLFNSLVPFNTIDS
jgi:hypothetical protein